MRWISHYEEYPIYEPAEGGYYYAGNQIVESERKSKRQCRKDFEEIWKKCLEENKENGFTKEIEDEWGDIIRNTHIFPWVRFDANYIFRDGYYIGEGESYVIEQKQGSRECGYEPYC